MSRVTVVAGERAVAPLSPLLRVWEAAGDLRVVPPADRPPLAALAAGADAVLVVGDRRRAPRTVLPGPVVRADDGRHVPVAWLPDTGAVDLACFAEAAASVHRRTPEEGCSVAVLGERNGRFDNLAERVLRVVREGGGSATRLTAYDVVRDDLVARLAGGPALAVYVGHGRPIGWVGYAGLRQHHWGPAVEPSWRPAGAVLSLTCRTASRRKVGLSFAESIPLQGVAAAAVGAFGPTLHTANARWAVRIAMALPTVRTIGELMVAVAPHDPEAARYRLLGDPTAPLVDDPAWAAGTGVHPDLQEATA